MPEKRLTVQEAAQRLGRNPLLLYRWISEGRLRAEWQTHIGVRDTLIYAMLRSEWLARDAAMSGRQ